MTAIYFNTCLTWYLYHVIVQRFLMLQVSHVPEILSYLKSFHDSSWRYSKSRDTRQFITVMHFTTCWRGTYHVLVQQFLMLQAVMRQSITIAGAWYIIIMFTVIVLQFLTLQSIIRQFIAAVRGWYIIITLKMICFWRWSLPLDSSSLPYVSTWLYDCSWRYSLSRDCLSRDCLSRDSLSRDSLLQLITSLLI